MTEYEFAVLRAPIREWLSPGISTAQCEDGMGWAVRLPEEGGHYAITGPEYGGVPHEQAVAEMEEFIAEAQEALTALREMREMGDPHA